MLMEEQETVIQDGNMPRRPTSPLSQDHVLTQLRAKRAYHAEQVAAIDNLLAGIDRALGGADATLTGASVFASAAPLLREGAATRPTEAPVNGLSFGCFHGYSFGAAAVATIPVIGDKNRPPNAGQIVAAISSTGYPISSTKPEGVLNGALKKREERERDVVLLGNGLWALTSWYTSAEIDQIRAKRGKLPLRNTAQHGEATRRGMRVALERGVHIGRPSNRLTPEAIEFARNMLLTGHKIAEVASAVHTSTTTVYNYFNIERDQDGRVITVTPKKDSEGQATVLPMSIAGTAPGISRSTDVFAREEEDEMN